MRKDRFHPPFEADTIYHLYSHAIGDERLFRSSENYAYFLKKYGQYVPPIADTFAYCLLPNHFHFLIRIKAEDELRVFFSGIAGEKPTEPKTNPPDQKAARPLHQLLGQQFGNFLNAYTKAYNKMYHNRKGGLFADDVSRLAVRDEAYFCNTLRYIHLNPIHHGFVQKLSDWEHSSFASYHSDKHTKLCKDFTLAIFGGIKGFNEAHTFDGLDVNGIAFD